MLGFTLESSDAKLAPYGISFDYVRESDRLEARPVRAHRPPSFVPMRWRKVPPFGGVIWYVSAERIGPRKLHLLSTSRARLGDLGPRGEFVINFISSHSGDEMLATDPRTMGERGRMIDVLDRWLQTVTPGAHLDFEPIQAADALIAGFTFERASDVASRRYRATNVGFGLSYVLPVLVALVWSPPGALVLIENPEAHLHPRGQTKLGELAARAAAAGVQILAETHSDHFMDGVRIAVRDHIVKPNEVSFHYFSQKGPGASVSTPSIDAEGRLSEWPAGFFDQHEENLVRLLTPPS
jgi:predicted ATPase